MSPIIPKVSVIIPLYNKAPYIKRALDSVFAQTVQDFEIVVVGGNSTDGGEDIVLGYSDPRIRFVKETGRGVSAARNQGVDEARAELVAFLDADDEWLPEFLETILRLRKQYPDAGMYGTGYVHIKENGEKISKSFHVELGDRKLPSFFSAKMEFCNGVGMLILTSGMVIEKKVYKWVGGFPEGVNMCEDRALRGKVALVSDVIYSPDVCVKYYNNITNSLSRQYEYAVDSFSEYIRSNPSLINRSKIDYASILDFAEANSLYLIWRNLHHSLGKRSDILRSLSYIQCPHNQIKKYILIIYCLLPKFVQRILYSIYYSLRYK